MSKSSRKPAAAVDAVAIGAPRHASRSRSPKAATAIPPLATDPAPPKTSKLDTLVGLLERTEGATIAAMMAATGWQAHSVRGALAGACKKKRGLNIVSAPAQGGRVYRIEPAQAA